MKITDISLQAKNPDRVNVSVDGKYRFSLDVFQVGELGVKLGKEYTDDELRALETESQFGKLYGRALEYCMLRPHSVREVRDYLYRKTLTKKYRDRQGEVKERQGYSPALTSRVLEKLQQKNYVSDESFARWWVENRNLTKGTSLRKLSAELRAKGVASSIIEEVLGETERTDEDELSKIVAKKRHKYTDDQKLMAYLARQGFSYDDIKAALSDERNY